MDYCMAAFISTHAALSAQALLDGHVAYLVMPTLRTVSASCGIALRIAPADYPAARAILEGSALPDDSYTFYSVEKEPGAPRAHITRL